MWIVIQIFLVRMAISFLSHNSQFSINDNGTVYNPAESNHYTATETQNIKLLRNLMGDELEIGYKRSDDFLIRWLRESAMNIKSASKMLRIALKWRKDNHIDTILNKTFTAFPTEICHVVGVDKTGAPVVLIRSTLHDTRKLLTSGLSEELINHSDQCMERYFQASVNSDSKGEIRVTQGIVIFDCEGFTAKQHACLRCIWYWQQVASHSTQYYPRFAKLVVNINAPRFARPAFEMVNPFLSPYFKKTMKIFGADKEEWKSYLLGVIPRDQLLQEYGGTKLMSF